MAAIDGLGGAELFLEKKYEKLFFSEDLKKNEQRKGNLLEGFLPIGEGKSWSNEVGLCAFQDELNPMSENLNDGIAIADLLNILYWIYVRFVDD